MTRVLGHHVMEGNQQSVGIFQLCQKRSFLRQLWRTVQVVKDIGDGKYATDRLRLRGGSG
jgi:hypothetical protein